MYRPELPAPTGSVSALANWCLTQFQRIAQTWGDDQESVTFRVLHAEPARPRAGMCVIADGTDWNPGNGAGLYERNETNTAWSQVAAINSDGTIVLPKAQGAGIQVDPSSPTYTWRDLEGPIRPRGTGVGTPSLTVYRSPIREYAFSANDASDMQIHWPHDWVPGTDVYLHVHWSHTGTNITGNLVISYAWTFSKGHNQGTFAAPSTLTQTISGISLATHPRYQHIIDEVQFSSASPTGGQADTDAFEVDGLLLMQVSPTTIPTVTGGSFFIHYVDIHYQSSNIGTKQKSPDFYT